MLNGDDAYAAVLAWKGAVFARQKAIRLAVNHGELSKLVEDLQAANQELARGASVGKQSPTDRRWRALDEKRDRLEGELARRSAEFRQVCEERCRTPEQIRRLLPENVVLIDLLEVCYPMAPGQGVPSAFFSPDVTRIIAAAPGAIRMWDRATRKEISGPAGHLGALRAVAFSPDGGQIATGSMDGSIRIWRTVDGEPLAALDGDSPVESVAFSPDGKTLVAISTRLESRADSHERARALTPKSAPRAHRAWCKPAWIGVHSEIAGRPC
jgi:hypothetical protein